jgi:hypothetical protein
LTLPGITDDRRRLLLRVGVVGLALLVGLIAWLGTRSDDVTEPAAEGFAARIVSEEELEEIAALSGHPVYWAGPVAGTSLEVSEGVGGGVQVSYLEQRTEGGGDQNDQLTIGSYPLADPMSALEGFAERENAIVRRGADGRKVVSSTEAPSSAYFVSPDGLVQIEVYDPSPKRAMSLALSGRVEAVG